MVKQTSSEEARRLAEAVRQACVQAAQEGYTRAAVSGLCLEGVMEAAIGAIRMANLDAVIAEIRIS